MLFLTSKSQITFKNDAAYVSYYSGILNEIDSISKFDHNNDFELRLFVSVDYFKKGRVFLMASKKGHWYAKFFESFRDTLTHFKETKIRTDSIAHLWKSLLNNNVLTIPNSWELRDSINEKPQTQVIDGTNFIIELITKNSKRRYSYHCPKSMKEEYPYILAYQNVVTIIKLIYQFCGISNFKVC